MNLYRQGACKIISKWILHFKRRQGFKKEKEKQLKEEVIKLIETHSET